MSHDGLFSTMEINDVLYIICIVSLIVLIDAVRELKIENWIVFCTPDNSSCLRALEYHQKVGNLGINMSLRHS